MKNLFKQQTIKEGKLAKLEKVLYTWFTPMPSEGKPVTGPTIIENAKSFYDGMNITEKCTFSEHWL
jgi:hypothetical protein